jgi:serine/threonine-protein kinase
VTTVHSPLAVAIRDRYLLERELGHGGMATVYLAQDLRHARQVAIKFLLPHVAAEVGSERFLREIRLAAQLHHPHILPLYDSGTLEVGDAGGGPKERPYYVMPYVEGESLRERLTREGRLPVEDALQITREIAEALDYAHRRNIVHRDIKPENILLEEGHALVMDFGIARAITAAGEEQLTAVGLLVGTPAYMSPEQVGGEAGVDGRSDVYSLGCVFYEMLTGVPPFAGPNLQAILIRRLLEGPPPLRTVDPAIPAVVEAAVARALARDPADRFATAAGLSAALETREGARLRSHSANQQPASGQRAGEASVAVLPFVNLSADPENEYFSDGVTEELINALVKVPGLHVASRTSCFALKGKDQDARAIGERLRVRTLVEGSVRKVGKRIRITAQLISVSDGYHLWSETYDRQLEDVFAVQDEIARTLARKLTPQLVNVGTVPLVEAGTKVAEAYTLYLRGRYFRRVRGTNALQIALERFNQAIAADPKFARAYAGAASAYTLLGFDVFAAMPALEAMPKAKAAITKALELDPMLGEALTSRAMITWLYDWDWARAEREFDYAKDLSTEEPTLHLHWYSMFLSSRGRHEESLRTIERALALEPLAGYLNAQLGRCHYYARQYDEAVARLTALVEMEPAAVDTSWTLAKAYMGQGKFREAAAELERSMSVAGRAPLLIAQAGAVYGALGQADKKLAALAELRAASARGYVPVMYEAMALTGPEDLDDAFRLWNIAYEQRSGMLPFSRVDPSWDPLRSDPRFAALLNKMRLDF